MGTGRTKFTEKYGEWKDSAPLSILSNWRFILIKTYWVGDVAQMVEYWVPSPAL
jgi:hypothetical protein